MSGMRRGIDYPHAVGASGDQSCDCVCKVGAGIDIENWERILTIVHAAGG